MYIYIDTYVYIYMYMYILIYIYIPSFSISSKLLRAILDHQLLGTGQVGHSLEEFQRHGERHHLTFGQHVVHGQAHLSASFQLLATIDFDGPTKNADGDHSYGTSYQREAGGAPGARAGAQHPRIFYSPFPSFPRCHSTFGIAGNL